MNKNVLRFTPAPSSENEAKRRQHNFDTGYVLVYMGRKVTEKGFDLAKQLGDAKHQDKQALAKAIAYLHGRAAGMTNAFTDEQKAEYQKKAEALDRFVRTIMESDSEQVSYLFDILERALRAPNVLICTDEELAAYQGIFNEENPTAPTIQQFAHVEKLIRGYVKSKGSLDKAFKHIWETVYNRVPQIIAQHWRATASYKEKTYEGQIRQMPDGFHLAIIVKGHADQNEVKGPYVNLDMAKAMFASKVRTRDLVWEAIPLSN